MTTHHYRHEQRRRPAALLITAALLLLAAVAGAAAADDPAPPQPPPDAAERAKRLAQIEQMKARSPAMLAKVAALPALAPSAMAAAAGGADGGGGAIGRSGARQVPLVPALQRVTSCVALEAAVAAMRDEAQNRRGGRSYRVLLDCPLVSGVPTFDGDCTYAGENLVMAFWGVGRLTIEAGPTCLTPGATRGAPPVSAATLSGAVGAPYDFFYLEGKSAWLTLKNVNIDCGRARSGIFAIMGGGLSLANVNVENCVGDYGPALLSIFTTVSVAGGRFEGNEAVPVPNGPMLASGGALFFYAGAPQIFIPDRGRRVALAGTVFKGNAAQQGGAVFVEKTSHTGIEFYCRKCVFDGNSAGECAHFASFKNDNPVEGRMSPRLFVDLGGSSFSSVGGGGSAACGGAIYPFRPTVIGGMRGTGLVKAVNYTRPSQLEVFNDYMYVRP